MLMTCLRIEHQHRPIVMQLITNCAEHDMRKIHECNETGKRNSAIRKIILSNDAFLRGMHDQCTCQGRAPGFCTNRVIGWASVVWTRPIETTEEMIYDCRIPFCQNCEQKVREKVKSYTQEHAGNLFYSPLHTGYVGHTA